MLELSKVKWEWGWAFIGDKFGRGSAAQPPLPPTHTCQADSAAAAQQAGVQQRQPEARLAQLRPIQGALPCLLRLLSALRLLQHTAVLSSAAVAAQAAVGLQRQPRARIAPPSCELQRSGGRGRQGRCAASWRVEAVGSRDPTHAAGRGGQDVPLPLVRNTACAAGRRKAEACQLSMRRRRATTSGCPCTGR